MPPDNDHGWWFDGGMTESQEATRLLREIRDLLVEIRDMLAEDASSELRHGHWEGHGSNERWIRDVPSERP